MVSGMLNGANRSLNRRMVAAWMRSLPLMMPCTPPRSSPSMSSSEVRRTASSNAKFGAADDDAGVDRQLLHPAGRPLQERHRTHQHRAATSVRPSAGQQRAKPDQAHVVVEGQPRHQRGVRRRNRPVVPSSRRISARGWRSRSRGSSPRRPASASTRTCTAGTPSWARHRCSRRRARRVEIQRVDLDHLGRRISRVGHRRRS